MERFLCFGLVLGLFFFFVYFLKASAKVSQVLKDDIKQGYSFSNATSE